MPGEEVEGEHDLTVRLAQRDEGDRVGVGGIDVTIGFRPERYHEAVGEALRETLDADIGAPFVLGDLRDLRGEGMHGRLDLGDLLRRRFRLPFEQDDVSQHLGLLVFYSSARHHRSTSADRTGLAVASSWRMP